MYTTGKRRWLHIRALVSLSGAPHPLDVFGLLPFGMPTTEVLNQPQTLNPKPWTTEVLHHVGSCQFLCRIILRAQKGTIILTTTHVVERP